MEIIPDVITIYGYIPMSKKNVYFRFEDFRLKVPFFVGAPPPPPILEVDCFARLKINIQTITPDCE